MGPGLAQGQGLVLHFLCAGPTLVGEVLAGFVLGPIMLDQVALVEELQILGQLALMVVLFERGLHTNFASIAACGAFGALMAILGIALSMTFVVIALRVNKVSFIESMCGGCIMSASVVGLVDIGWSRRQVKDINPCNSLASKVIDAGTTVSAMFMLAIVSILRNIDPESKWYHPVDKWWVVCQPMLFSLAFIVGSIFIRSLFAFFCLKDVMGKFFPPKNDPASELYNAFEFAQVCRSSSTYTGLQEPSGAQPLCGWRMFLAESRPSLRCTCPQELCKSQSSHEYPLEYSFLMLVLPPLCQTLCRPTGHFHDGVCYRHGRCSGSRQGSRNRWDLCSGHVLRRLRCDFPPGNA